MTRKIKVDTRVTTSIADVGFVRSIPFFIMMVVMLIRKDDRSASVNAMHQPRFRGNRIPRVFKLKGFMTHCRPELRYNTMISLQDGALEAVFLIFHDLFIGCKSQKTPGNAPTRLDQVRNNF